MIPWFQRRRVTPADLAPVAVPPSTEPTPKSVLAARAFTLPPEPAPAVPAPRFAPGRYVVRYDAFRPHGVPEPGVFTLVADSAADLAEQVRTDISPFLGSHRVEVTVDMVVSGGMIRCGSVSGAFTFTRGGAR
ncbi:hypothetical protein [Streptomyces sp. NPDC021224]|uniref:hypothetical protein n=1 Tax=unclassified Streptomyces TaxID=2593676 RepID=UPI0037A0E232